MMNKKGISVGKVTTFLTYSFVLAIIFFIFIIPFGAGGGLKAAFDLGKITAAVFAFLATLPVWSWVVVAVIIFLIIMRSDK